MSATSDTSSLDVEAVSKVEQLAGVLRLYPYRTCASLLGLCRSLHFKLDTRENASPHADDRDIILADHSCTVLLRSK
jgi:hypothetical protein